MTKKKIKSDISSVEVEPVVLKPFLGISPGIYLTILYIFIILLASFFFFIFPGMRNPGSYTSVTSVPSGAAVFFDGQYAGSTPVKTRITAGEQDMVIQKQYFSSHTERISIPYRIFGNTVFHRTFHIDVSLSLSDPEGFLKDRFLEFSKWAQIDGFHTRYQRPAIAEKAVRDFLDGMDSDQTGLPSSSLSGESKSLLYQFMYNLMQSINTIDDWNDLLRAVSIISPGSPDPDSLSGIQQIEYLYNFTQSDSFTDNILSVITDIRGERAFDTVHSEIALVYYFLLDSGRRGELMADQGFRKLLSKYEDFLQSNNSTATFTNVTTGTHPPAISFSDLRFIRVDGGSFVSGLDNDLSLIEKIDKYGLSSVPGIFSTQDFYIADREITVGDYRRFLAENPFWNKSNLLSLLEAGFVTPDYLLDFDSLPNNMPAAYVSWYAAQAYCQWLESKLPAELSGYSVRLPGRNEFEYASLHNYGESGVFLRRGGQSGPSPASEGRAGALGIMDLSGNLWEWSEDWFLPSDLLFRRSGIFTGNEAFEAAERTVLGGSWGNRDTDVHSWTRGSQPPDWCTPFLGFRPVLVRSDFRTH